MGRGRELERTRTKPASRAVLGGGGAVAAEYPRTPPRVGSVLVSPALRSAVEPGLGLGLELRAGARRPAPDGSAEPGAGRGADARLGRALAASLGRGRALRHSPASAVSGRGPKRLRRSQPRPSSLGTGGTGEY